MAESEFMRTALEAARAAADIIRHYYRGQLDITLKADHTPVTQADVEAEQAIRDIITGRFADHGFFGEETGAQEIDREYLWLVDPIDGTKSFIRRYPFFSTQIALMKDGELVLGVSSAPEFDEIAWAEKGSGAWLNDERIEITHIEAIDRASISTGNLATLANSTRWEQFGRIVAQANRIRGYGDFYHYHLLAAGKIDAVIESDVNILDIAALAVIVREAGGVFTDLYGRPLDLDTTSVLAANSSLHATLLEML